MDPLSVLASVVGILAAASKVASTLSGIKSSLVDAPQTIDHALSQVNGVRIALSAIEKLLLGIDGAQSKRIAMIQVDDLVATLTEAVLTFDELEALVSPFSGISKIAIKDRIKWAWEKDQVEDILVRLERHKSTMLLMLSITQSESDIEAEKSQNDLRGLVLQVLENNTDIARRLEDMVESRSILTNCFRNGNACASINIETSYSRRSSTFGPSDNSSVRNSSPTTRHQSAARFSGSIFQHSFEADLNTTRVYARTRLYGSDQSFTTSDVRTHVWSVFSGLSLSEISNIAVIALPLYLYELRHSHWYMPGQLGNSADRETDPSPPVPGDSEPSTISKHLAATHLEPPPANGRNLVSMESTTIPETVMSQPLFQTCVPLLNRLAQIPGCSEHLICAAKGVKSDGLDPVSLLWISLRTTTLLLTIYNSTQIGSPLQLNDAVDPARRPKLAAFKFIEACLKELMMPPTECFSLHDLFGSDIAGFLKVTRFITRVLDKSRAASALTGLEIDSTHVEATTTRLSPPYRDIVIRELVETERKYVQSLEQLVNLKIIINESNLLPMDVTHRIFLNIEAILNFGRSFLAKIEMMYSLPNDKQEWGSLFTEDEEAFGVYLPYIANRQKSTATAAQEFNLISRIDHALTVDINTLEMFLVRPLPRLLKYPIILKDVRDRTGADEKTKADLTSGVEAIDRVIQKVNDGIDRELRVEILNSLCATMEDWKGYQVERFGELLLFGQFPVGHVLTKGYTAMREYRIYLFDRILLACKEVNSTKQGKNKNIQKDSNTKLRLKGRILMSAVTQVISLAEPDNYRVRITFNKEPEVECFFIQFANKGAMMKWYHTVEAQRKKHAASLSSSTNSKTQQQEYTANISSPIMPAGLTPLVSEDEWEIIDDESWQDTPPLAHFPIARNGDHSPGKPTETSTTPLSSTTSNSERFEVDPSMPLVKINLTRAGILRSFFVLSSINHKGLLGCIEDTDGHLSDRPITSGILKLRYRDKDGDLCTLESDEDLQVAFQEGFEMLKHDRHGNQPQAEIDIKDPAASNSHGGGNYQAGVACMIGDGGKALVEHLEDQGPTTFDSATSIVSQEYYLSETVEVTQRTDDQDDAHVVEEVQELEVLEERHWVEEEVDSDVVEGVEEGAEHRTTARTWLGWVGLTQIRRGARWLVV
ncbi:hypothetical protein IFR05_008316 [Cadophora sp. M221]|nr:hypothetical protein IFR05_008316 [Cadophora sp. M221]